MGEVNLSCLAADVELAYLSHFLPREFGTWASLSTEIPTTLINCVVSVVVVAASEKVFWPDAWLVVTRMAHAHTCRYLAVS